MKTYQPPYTHNGYPPLSNAELVNALGSSALGTPECPRTPTKEDLQEADRHRITWEAPQTD